MMLERLRDFRWQNALLQPLSRGDVTEDECNKHLNELLVKLHLLDPTLIHTAHRQLQKGEKYFKY